jgi:hypothetical protein
MQKVQKLQQMVFLGDWNFRNKVCNPKLPLITTTLHFSASLHKARNFHKLINFAEFFSQIIPLLLLFLLQYFLKVDNFHKKTLHLPYQCWRIL